MMENEGNDNDYIAMKEIQKYANIIPVIGKADSLSEKDFIIKKINVIQKS